jgi:hypothetical protein
VQGRRRWNIESKATMQINAKNGKGCKTVYTYPEGIVHESAKTSCPSYHILSINNFLPHTSDPML